jgi:DNA-binding PadR family transcriptional regulator
MLRLSDMEIAVLGLICEKPMHGYEIEKTIEERNMRYWTQISFPSIYKVLSKLEKKGAVKAEFKLSKNNLSQKIYSASNEGRRMMKESVVEILSNVEKTVWRVDLGIANLCILSKEEVQENLSKYIKSIDENIEIYKQVQAFFEKENYPLSDHALATRPVLHLQAEKEWALKFKELLEKNE